MDSDLTPIDDQSAQANQTTADVNSNPALESTDSTVPPATPIITNQPAVIVETSFGRAQPLSPIQSTIVNN